MQGDCALREFEHVAKAQIVGGDQGFYCTVGLIWADGDCVFITPLQPPKNSVVPHGGHGGHGGHGQAQVHFCRHQVLGLFRIVHGLCYSSPKKWPPYISGILSKFQVMCVLALPQLPVLQGCLWHPERDVFCLVFKDSARIYVINEESSELQEVKTITPFAGSRFVCGTWSKNGKRLILATESTLVFYNIPCADMEQAEMEVILGLERVCCIESMEGERFVCTVELPMEQVVVRSRSERCLLEQQQQQAHSRGALEAILSIHSDGGIEGGSQLFLLQWNPETDKPEVRSWDELFGILSPDLLAVEPSTGLIVVGSNLSHTLYVYGVADEQLEKLHDINLPREERPKGVTIHNQEALLMIAKGVVPDDRLPLNPLPRPEFIEYEVLLQSIPLSTGSSSAAPSACTLRTLLGQHAKSSVSLDSTISDGGPGLRARAASTASSSHMLNRTHHVDGVLPLGSDSQPSSTMTWPRGLLGDLKTHLQQSAGPPPQRPMSAHANHHHHQGPTNHPSHLGAQSEGHLAAAAQQGGGKLLDDLNSLLHFHDGVRDSNHVANDMMDLQSLLSGAGISSDALGAVGDDPDYRKLAGFHEELFKRGASGHDMGTVGADVRRNMDRGSHTLPREHGRDRENHQRSDSYPGDNGVSAGSASNFNAISARLVSLEDSLTGLTRTQARELQEIKNELSAIRRLLISVLFHVLPGEARSDAVSKYT
ncbi:WD repeat-containing protein C2orf44-like [Tropilaelaps mercedesae]|uniref:WD repeat and coiled-coil-containing protein n=1 Tax=Tropilaelaps mercedesae TaxID=418985 RepID=A0A1V9XG84_9ACAR|nr:WD repeat-containing protein C2orf44-like [Tropilaelaps mercedesae]